MARGFRPDDSGRMIPAGFIRMTALERKRKCDQYGDMGRCGWLKIAQQRGPLDMVIDKRSYRLAKVKAVGGLIGLLLGWTDCTVRHLCARAACKTAHKGTKRQGTAADSSRTACRKPTMKGGSDQRKKGNDYDCTICRPRDRYIFSF